jgi:hypothetical protein
VHSRFAADGDFYLRLAATLAIGIVGDMPSASVTPEPALDDEILCGGC